MAEVEDSTGDMLLLTGELDNTEFDGAELAGPDGSFGEDAKELEGKIPPDVELGPVQPVGPPTLGRVLGRTCEELPGPVTVLNSALDNVVAELMVKVVTSVVVSSVS